MDFGLTLKSHWKNWQKWTKKTLLTKKALENKTEFIQSIPWPDLIMMQKITAIILGSLSPTLGRYYREEVLNTELLNIYPVIQWTIIFVNLYHWDNKNLHYFLLFLQTFPFFNLNHCLVLIMFFLFLSRHLNLYLM